MSPDPFDIPAFDDFTAPADFDGWDALRVAAIMIAFILAALGLYRFGRLEAEVECQAKQIDDLKAIVRDLERQGSAK